MRELNYKYRDEIGFLSGTNYAASIELYERAIKLDYTSAMCIRANMYRYSHGVPNWQPNYEAAIELYERAIKLNSLEALRSRAHMLSAGQAEPNGEPNNTEFFTLMQQYIELRQAKMSLYRQDKPDGI